MDTWKGKGAVVKSFYSMSKEENNIDIILTRTHKCLKLMADIDIKRNILIRKVETLRREFSKDRYEMYPNMFEKDSDIKNEVLWLREIKETINAWMHNIITLEGTILFVQTINIINKARAFFDFWKGEVKKASIN